MEFEKKKLDRRSFLLGSADLGGFILGCLGPLRINLSEFTKSPPRRTIHLDQNGSYTFISIGDSLAAGWGGINNAQGVPESWVGPMVAQLNTVRQRHTRQPTAGSSSSYRDWQYVSNFLLSEAGLTSGGLLDKMQSPDVIHSLETPNQAVLCVSLGFNDIDDFRTGTVLDFLMLHTKLDSYQQNLQSIIEKFKIARTGKEDYATCILLGLPNLDEVPAVTKAVRGTLLEGRAGLIAKEVNQRMVAVCNSSVDISMAYVDLFNHSSIPKSLFSSDGLHPNGPGYEQIGAIAAQTVDIMVE